MMTQFLHEHTSNSVVIQKTNIFMKSTALIAATSFLMHLLIHLFEMIFQATAYIYYLFFHSLVYVYSISLHTIYLTFYS